MPLDDSAFERALDATLEHEGFDQFVNDPADPGGATKWGVSLRFLKSLGDQDGDGLHDGDYDGDGDVDADDVKALTRGDAALLYKARFWDKILCGSMDHEIVAAKIFDLAVNMGPRQAGRILQRALRACGVDVVEDGVIGPKTVKAVNSVTTPHVLRAAIRSEAAGFYRALVAKRPGLSRFIKGWLRRAYA